MAKSGIVKVEFKTAGGPRKIIPRIQDEDIRRAAAEDLAHILLDKVNEYVPESSGLLKRTGYTIRFAERGAGAVVSSLSYNNSRKVPYVLYQYYGVVYGPNFATFDVEKYNPKDLRMRSAVISHTGWVSAKGKGSKRPTKNILGHPKKHQIEIYPGAICTITGYTKNKNAQHKWLEYVRNTATIWYPLRQHMIKYVEQFYAQYLGNDKEGHMYPNKNIATWHSRRGK